MAETEWQEKESGQYPEFDMEQYLKGGYSGDELVYAERFTARGGILRVKGPSREVAKMVHAFMQGQTEVSKLEAARARSEAHKQAFFEGQKSGTIPKDAEFVPIDWDSKNINLTNEEVYGK